MNNISDIPSARPEDVGMDGDRLSRINDRMAAHIDQGNIQGAVTAVARGGRVVHFEAHGEKDTRDNTRCRRMRCSAWRPRRNQSWALPP